MWLERQLDVSDLVPDSEVGGGVLDALLGTFRKKPPRELQKDNDAPPVIEIGPAHSHRPIVRAGGGALMKSMFQQDL